MAIISTERNTVYAYDVQPHDVMVEVSWAAPAGDGKHLRPITLPMRPISAYAECVEFAKEMADGMAHAIHVVPLNHGDILNTERFAPYREFLANLNDQERGEVRRIIVGSCAEIMRDCGDHAVRSEAYDVLVKMKVVRHES